MYSAAELIARAADLCSDSAGLVHDDERRWRERIGQVVQAMPASAEPATGGEAPDDAR